MFAEQIETLRRRGRPPGSKNKPKEPDMTEAAPIEIKAEDGKRKVFIGTRACMTSLGPSHLSNGVMALQLPVALPEFEADNLVNLGYATYA